jgi:sugar phosphate permease
MNQSSAPARPSALSPGTLRRQLYRMVAAIGVVYVMSQFYRTANGVIAKDLMAEFSLSAEALGILTGAFFLSFAAMQIPLGMLFDRFGPRRTVPVLLIFAIVGTLVFGLAEGYVGLLIGRLLMGVGVCGVLMGALFIFGRWAGPDEYSTWMGRMVAIGGAGALLSATPLAWTADAHGWRYAFFGAAAITALGAILFYAIVRDTPPGQENGAPATSSQAHHGLHESFAGMIEVFRIPRLWPILAMAFVSYPVTITILGLWGAPWLIDAYGIDKVTAGNVLLGMAVALMIASMVLGPLERRLNTRKRLAIGFSTAVGIALVLLAALPAPPLFLGAALLVVIGGSSAYNIIVASHGRSLFPDRLAGRGMALIGIALMGGPFIMQAITGLIVGAFEAPETAGGAVPLVAYRAVFAFLAACIVAANLLYLRVPDAKPSAGFARDEADTSDD